MKTILTFIALILWLIWIAKAPPARHVDAGGRR